MFSRINDWALKKMSKGGGFLPASGGFAQSKAAIFGFAVIVLAAISSFTLAGCENSEYGGEVVLNNLSSETVTGRVRVSDHSLYSLDESNSSSFEVSAGQKETLYSRYEKRLFEEYVSVSITNTGLRLSRLDNKGDTTYMSSNDTSWSFGSRSENPLCRHTTHNRSRPAQHYGRFCAC